MTLLLKVLLLALRTVLRVVKSRPMSYLPHNPDSWACRCMRCS